MLLKFASLAVIDAKMASSGSGLVKDAHRHEFDYEPQPGFLYVRSRAISSRCNDNFDEFPGDQIKTAWNTFIGKPVFVNHKNDDPRRARGVIVDAALHEDVNPDGSEDTWVEVLMEVDAVRFPRLAKAILAGEIDRTSMGTNVEYSLCSFCGNKAATPLEYCQHIPAMKGQRIYRRNASTGKQEGVLVREICYGLGFFENSLLVEDPADPTAFFLGVDARGVEGASSVAASHVRTAAQEDSGISPQAALSGPAIQAMERVVTEHLGHYNAAVTWLLQHQPDATPERVAEVILDRDSQAVRKMTGMEGYIVDRDQWYPRLISSVSAMLAEVNSVVTTGSRRTASKIAAPARTQQCVICRRPITFSEGQWIDLQGYEVGHESTHEGGPARHYHSPGGQISASKESPNDLDWWEVVVHRIGDEASAVEFSSGDYAKAREYADSIVENDNTAWRVWIMGLGPTNGDHMEKVAFGEVPAPAKVDTLREDTCPVCGEKDSYNGDECMVCNYAKPPSQFTDPDTSKAKEQDLRQEQQEQAAGDPAVPGQEGQPADAAPVQDLDHFEPPGDAVADEAEVPAEDDAADKDAPDDAADADGKAKPPADGAATDKDEKDDDEDPSKPDFLKKKKDPKKKASTQIAADQHHGEGADVAMRPTLAALAEQQIVLEAQQEAIDTIATLAGIDLTAIKQKAGQRIAAHRRTADVDNPAQPIPDPPSEAPVVTTQEALAPDATDDPTAVGASPLTDVAPDATTDVQGTATVLDEPLDLNEVDVTAPVAGTEEVRPLDEVRTETEQRMGEGTDQVAFPMADGGWTTGSIASEGRTFAALRLARLRIQAGIDEGDDLTLGQQIASDESLDDAGLQREIDTLAKVVTATARTAAAAPSDDQRRRLVPTTGAARTVPSMAPTGPTAPATSANLSQEALVSTAMAVTDEESLFE
jgi:hypothetical protein